jgi:hypothetical protein
MSEKMGFVEAVQKEQKKVQETVPPISVGCYVMPNNEASVMGEGAQMADLRKKEYCGLVTHIDSGWSVGNGKTCRRIIVRFPITDITEQEYNFAYGETNLRVLSAKESKEVLAKMADNAKKAVALAEAKLKEITSAKRVRRALRDDFDITKKAFLNTNYNYIKLGSGLTDDFNLKGGVKNYVDAVCCSLTKTTLHIQVNIPVEWMAYFGYSIIDLKRWLRFLEDCNLGFKAHYLGKTTLADEFTAKSINVRLPKYGNNNMYVSPNMECFKVVIESPSGSTNMQNYMRFLLVRYLYNNLYWNIPLIAMQIKDALKSKITSWEALLVAHMNYTYNAYYALTANQVAPGSGGQVAIPNKANSPAQVLSKLGGGSNVNTSLIYTHVKEDVSKLIRAKDYKAILALVENWRDK